MNLTLRILSLGTSADPRAFPGITDRTLQVSRPAEASAACLDHIRGLGLARDQWAGGILTRPDGSEVGQVSYLGYVFERIGQRYESIYTPPNGHSHWQVDPVLAWSIPIDVPGHGSVDLAHADDDDAPTRLRIASRPGFAVGGVPCEYSANLDIGADGPAIVHMSDECRFGDDGYGDPPEGLSESVLEALGDWLAEAENSQRLCALVEHHAVNAIDWSRCHLDGNDGNYEDERRALLARTLEVLAFREGLAAAAPAPRP